MISKTYELDVDGIGHFVIAHRTIESGLRIEHERQRIGFSAVPDGATEEQELSVRVLNHLTEAVAALKVLVVEAPAAWDMSAIDPEVDGGYEQILTVYGEVKQAEARFRESKASRGKAPRQGDAVGAGVVVPSEVQPPA